jgi:cytochrome P450
LLVTTEPTVLGSDFYQSPLPYFDLLRAEGPVYHVVLPTGLRAWLVTDFVHAKELLTDVRLSKSRKARAQLLAERSGHRPVAQDNVVISSHMLAADPPDHGRLRALVNRGFTARRVAALRDRIEEITAELLDAIPDDVEVDLLDSLAFPLAMAVIGELLGVPAGERARFRSVVHTLFAAGREQAEYEQSVAALLDYLRQLIARARAEPSGTLVSALIEARDGMDRLSEDELSSVAGLLLTAGYETTASLIGSGVLTLLEDPDQLTALRADQDLIPAAVEELLRFCGPVYLATPRSAQRSLGRSPAAARDDLRRTAPGDPAHSRRLARLRHLQRDRPRVARGMTRTSAPSASASATMRGSSGRVAFPAARPGARIRAGG